MAPPSNAGVAFGSPPPPRGSAGSRPTASACAWASARPRRPRVDLRGGVPAANPAGARRASSRDARASRPSGCAARVWARPVGRLPPPACPPTPPPTAWPASRRARMAHRFPGGRGIALRRREPRVRGCPLRLLPPLLRDLFHRVVLLALQLRLLDALRVGARVSRDGSVEPSLAVVRLAIDDPLGRAELLDALFVLEVRHGEVIEDLLRRGERRELRLSASFDGWEEGAR